MLAIAHFYEEPAAWKKYFFFFFPTLISDKTPLPVRVWEVAASACGRGRGLHKGA